MDKIEKLGPTGVGGWILVLAAQLIVGSLIGAGYTYHNIVTSESQYPALLTFDKWATYKSITWCFFTIFAALKFYCVWDLLMGKTWSTIKRTIVIMWATAPIGTSSCSRARRASSSARRIQNSSFTTVAL